MTRAILHRTPAPLRSLLLRVRGVRWNRQLSALISSRSVPERSRAVSVVIPSYNDLPLLRACLNSLEKTLRPDDEIIVVDDYCQPENSAQLQTLATERTTVLLKQERLGFAGTVNVGMQHARHDIVLLNSDIVALAGWIEYLQEASASTGFRAMVSPKLVYPDGRIQYGGTFWARSFAPQWFAHRFAGQKFNFPPSSIRLPNWGASGAALYVPREIYDRLGGLDDEYWLGFEDVDYAMQAWSNGFSSLYEPAAILVHHESATRGKHQGNREYASMRRFWSKWAKLHTERTVDGTRVHFAIGRPGVGDELWMRYVQAAAEALRGRGYTVSTGSEFSTVPTNAVSLVFDHSLTESAWYHHVLEGLVLEVVRTPPSSPANVQSAWFLPETDFICASPVERDVLQRATAWPTIGLVTPAFAPSSPAPAINRVVVVANNANMEMARCLEYPGVDIEVMAAEHLDEHSLRQAMDRSPRILVGLSAVESGLVASALLTTGAVFIGVFDERWQHILQDGLNCFQVQPVREAVDERVSGMLENQTWLTEVLAGAQRTANYFANALGSDLDSAVRAAVARRAHHVR